MASIIGATRVIKYKKFERQKAKKKGKKAALAAPKPNGPPLEVIRKASPPIPLPRPFAFEPAKT